MLKMLTVTLFKLDILKKNIIVRENNNFGNEVTEF